MLVGPYLSFQHAAAAAAAGDFDHGRRCLDSQLAAAAGGNSRCCGHSAPPPLLSSCCCCSPTEPSPTLACFVGRPNCSIRVCPLPTAAAAAAAPGPPLRLPLPLAAGLVFMPAAFLRFFSAASTAAALASARCCRHLKARGTAGQQQDSTAKGPKLFESSGVAQPATHKGATATGEGIHQEKVHPFRILLLEAGHELAARCCVLSTCDAHERPPVLQLPKQAANVIVWLISGLVSGAAPLCFQHAQRHL